jgi:hypothetical protein
VSSAKVVWEIFIRYEVGLNHFDALAVSPKIEWELCCCPQGGLRRKYWKFMFPRTEIRGRPQMPQKMITGSSDSEISDVASEKYWKFVSPRRSEVGLGSEKCWKFVSLRRDTR